MSTTNESFRFTDQQWRDYQDMPEQGYSHRNHLEFVFNAWLGEHDRAVAAAAWARGASHGYYVERGHAATGPDMRDDIPDHLVEEFTETWNPYANALVVGAQDED